MYGFFNMTTPEEYARIAEQVTIEDVPNTAAGFEHCRKLLTMDGSTIFLSANTERDYFAYWRFDGEQHSVNFSLLSSVRKIFVKSYIDAFRDFGIYSLVNGNWGPSKQRLPHILNLSFPGVDGKALALLLSKEGVCVSAGAACTTGDNEPSHVLMAMYRDEARARSAIRISLSHENTAEECEQAAKKIAECVAHLRDIG